jgi:hypothetical protein
LGGGAKQNLILEMGKTNCIENFASPHPQNPHHPLFILKEYILY